MHPLVGRGDVLLVRQFFDALHTAADRKAQLEHFQWPQLTAVCVSANSLCPGQMGTMACPATFPTI